MATPEDAPATGLLTIPRAVLSVAAGVVSSVERVVVGDARMTTARGNAWDAMCDDRARRQARDETRRLIVGLAATPDVAQDTVGSSPRSSASQADLVSAGSIARR